jgi:FAD/FMN-containing dehydrogenase
MNIEDLGLEGEVYRDKMRLDAFSRDASIFKIKPSVIVAPKNVEDVKALVNCVSNKKRGGENISLTARSAGTCMSGGSLTESVVVSFTEHFNHVKVLGSDYAVTEMGVYYRDFEKETLKSGMILPSYPASRDLCAMGGIVNNNSAGEKMTMCVRYLWSVQMAIFTILKKRQRKSGGISARQIKLSLAIYIEV